MLMVQYAVGPANMPEGLLTRMLAYSLSTLQAFIMVEEWQDPALVGRVMLMHASPRHKEVSCHLCATNPLG
jgi:hypothetical protein